MLEAFLRRYPSGIYAELARARVQELEQLAREREQRGREASDARDREAREAREREARQREAREREAREAREGAAREAREREAREAREREAREAREREARAKVALSQPPPQPPRTGLLGYSDAVGRITAWIDHDFNTDNVAYSAIVDWYDEGMISRDTVLKQRAKYFARWPERQFTLIPSSVQIAGAGANRYAVVFERSYVVRSLARKAQSSGKSRVMIDVEMIDGLPHVARQRETTGR